MTRIVEIFTLPGTLSAEKIALIRQAKALLDTDIKIVLRPASPGCGKVLAFETPAFACDYAPVETATAQGLSAALAWYLGLVEDSRAIAMAKWLSGPLGGVVTELEGERIESTIKFH